MHNSNQALHFVIINDILEGFVTTYLIFKKYCASLII